MQEINQKVEALKEELKLALKDDNTERAFQICEDALKEHPEDSNVLVEIGNLYQLRKEYSIALDYYLKAYALSSDSWRVNHNLGLNYYYLKEYDRALAHLEKALHVNELDSNKYFTFNSLANLLLELDKDEEALGYYMQAIAINPDGFSAKYNLGKYYEKKELWSKIIEIFTGMYSAVPHSQAENFHFVLGNAYLKSNQYDYAIPTYERLVELRPDAEYYHSRLAFMYESAQEYRKASKHYKQIILLNPNKLVTWQNLTLSILFSEGSQAAIEYAKKGLELFPNDEFLLFLCGWQLYEIKNYDESEILINKVASDNKDEPGYLVVLGLIAFRKNQLDKSKRLFKRVLKSSKNPNLPNFSSILTEVLNVLDSIRESELIAMFKTKFDKPQL